MHVGGTLTWIMDRPPEGMVDFSFAQVDRLDDRAGNWPEGRYRLTGFTFRPAYALTVEERIDWLAAARTTTSQAPTSSLAQSYRLGSGDRAARRIAIAGQRDLRNRGGLSRKSRAWNWFLDVSVGYGYRLQRPFLVLLALVLISWGLYYWGARAGLIYSTQSSHVVVAPECPVGYPWASTHPHIHSSC